MTNFTHIPALAAMAAVLFLSGCSKENVAPAPALTANSADAVTPTYLQEGAIITTFGYGDGMFGFFPTTDPSTLIMRVTNVIPAGAKKVIYQLRSVAPLTASNFVLPILDANGGFISQYGGGAPSWPYRFENASTTFGSVPELVGYNIESDFKVDIDGNAFLKITATKI